MSNRRTGVDLRHPAIGPLALAVVSSVAFLVLNVVHHGATIVMWEWVTTNVVSPSVESLRWVVRLMIEHGKDAFWR